MLEAGKGLGKVQKPKTMAADMSILLGVSMRKKC